MIKNLRYYLLGVGAALIVGLLVVVVVWQPWADSDRNGQASAGVATGASDTNLSTDPSATEIEGIMATTDLSVGPNRLSFLLVGADGIVMSPEASVTSLYFREDGSPGLPKDMATARLHLWPYGTRANYATELSFDKPGKWGLDVRVMDGEGQVSTVRIPLKVSKDSLTPALGSEPPRSDNKTLRDVTSLKELTSWSSPDPELYALTIADAVASHKPLMLVFSSPSICTSPTCGPQVDVVQELKEVYKSEANFIHVEVYDNPDDIQGDLGKARYSPVVEAWGLTRIEGYLNESWVFILDRDGRIASKYEGFAAADELESGLRSVLQ